MHTLLTFTTLFSLTQAQVDYQTLVDTIASSIPPYTYVQGGLNWEGLCATGQRQSPVDILTAETETTSDPDFSAISFDIPRQLMPEVDLGIHPLYAMNGTQSAVFNGVPSQFNFMGVHYHIPAQQVIDGLRYAAEIHLTLENADESGQEQTITVLFREGQRSVFFDDLLNGDEVDISSILPSPIEDYFYYIGSVEAPMPDCYEVSNSVVLNQVQEISIEQIERIRTGPEAIPFAIASGHGLYREVQPLNGRTVYHRVPDAGTRSFLAI